MVDRGRFGRTLGGHAGGRARGGGRRGRRGRRGLWSSSLLLLLLLLVVVVVVAIAAIGCGRRRRWLPSQDMVSGPALIDLSLIALLHIDNNLTPFGYTFLS